MQCQTVLETTSCVYKEGDIILRHQQSLDLCGLHQNPRDLWNLIPLKYISYLHKVALLRFHCFPWKRYNFNWLKDIFCEYYIKRMKEFLSWLLYPIGCGPTTFFVFCKSIWFQIGTNIKYDLFSCQVTYAFQSKATFYSCLNVKELLARSRCEIWS